MALHTKKLYYRRGGSTYSINLYTTTTDVGSNYFMLRDGSTTVYAKLGDVSDSLASYLRLRKSSTTYAVLASNAPIVDLSVTYDISNSSSYPGSGTALYDLDGTQTTTNATLVNGVGYSSGNGGYLTFDGTDDYVMMGSRVSMDLAAGSTVIWYNPTTWSPSGNGEYFWCCGGTPFSGGTFNWLGAHSTYSSNISIGVYMPGGHRVAAHTSAPTPGTWYHVVGSWGAFGIKIAINGYYTGSNATADWDYYAANASNIYEYLGAGGSPDTGANCKIGSAKIVNWAMSDAEVLADFNATKARFGY